MLWFLIKHRDIITFDLYIFLIAMRKIVCVCVYIYIYILNNDATFKYVEHKSIYNNVNVIRWRKVCVLGARSESVNYKSQLFIYLDHAEHTGV
jgi:hypothetical protein